MFAIDLKKVDLIDLVSILEIKEAELANLKALVKTPNSAPFLHSFIKDLNKDIAELKGHLPEDAFLAQPEDVQDTIKKRFTMPKVVYNVFIDKHGRPFAKEKEGHFYLSLKPQSKVDNFHNHYVENVIA